jgi:hypothetical protein
MFRLEASARGGLANCPSGATGWPVKPSIRMAAQRLVTPHAQLVFLYRLCGHGPYQAIRHRRLRYAPARDARLQ